VFEEPAAVAELLNPLADPQLRFCDPAVVDVAAADAAAATTHHVQPFFLQERDPHVMLAEDHLQTHLTQQHAEFARRVIEQQNAIRSLLHG